MTNEKQQRLEQAGWKVGEAPDSLATEPTEAAPFVPQKDEVPAFLNHCQANGDGDCVWDKCPQLRDNEPRATGRHCPIDKEIGYYAE